MKFLKPNYKLKILPEEELPFETVVFPIVRNLQPTLITEEQIADIAMFHNIDVESELTRLLAQELVKLGNVNMFSDYLKINDHIRYI
jgi:hypothetical protein